MQRFLSELHTEKICYLLSDSKKSVTHKVGLFVLAAQRLDKNFSSKMQYFDPGAIQIDYISLSYTPPPPFMTEDILFPMECCLFHISFNL